MSHVLVCGTNVNGLHTNDSRCACETRMNESRYAGFSIYRHTVREREKHVNESRFGV